MRKSKSWVWGIILGLGIGFLVLRPSLNLALTGDDYLGLFRYYYTINGWSGGPKFSPGEFFFTDYGPMDTLTAVIHHYWGFKHQVYYLFALGLRTLAALSFIWPVYILSKNRFASIASMAFFLVTTTGLEVTDWSFNMPSYAAIAILNIFLGVFITSRNNKLWLMVPLGLFFGLTIIVQPLRLMFLPIMTVGLEAYWLITNLSFKSFVMGIIRIGIYAGIFLLLLRGTHYGESVGAKGLTAMKQNYGGVEKFVSAKNYQVLLSPVAQLGLITLPNDLVKQSLAEWGLSTTFKFIVIPNFVFFCLGIILLQKLKGNYSKILTGICISAGVVWHWYIWQTLMAANINPIQPYELKGYLLGGSLIIWSVTAWWLYRWEKHTAMGIVIAGGLMCLGFIVAWLRFPGTLYLTTGRYLIVPAMGLTWGIGTILALAKTRVLKFVTYLLFGFFFSIHASSSYTYLDHLSDVRGIELTDKIRSVVRPKLSPEDLKQPLVFYFDGDNEEILHHAFIFGLPTIMGIEYNMKSWYNIAPTTDWKEVVSAYTDGQSLKRFMPGPYGPVKLEHIFAYKLRDRNITDITDEKRQELIKMKVKTTP